MSLKLSKKIDTNRYELEIEVGSEEFKQAVDKSYRKQSSRIAIPGFRKGKAPRAFIEKYYGKEVFYEDAINSVYPEALDEAIKDANLDVIDDHMDFDIVNVGDEGLTFKVALTVKPEVSIEGYKGLEVTAKTHEVTEEDVEHEIKLIQERNSRLITVEDKTAEMGDIVVIDFEGFKDGVAFDGGKAENYSLDLGKGGFIPGFEEQIVGHNIGDKFDINVTFPNEYQEESLAGKDAIFKIKLREIKKKELPEIDDEFVKDVSEFNNLDEYKNDIKSKLVERNEANTKNDIDNQLVDKLAEMVKVEVPEAMYRNKIKEMIRDFAYRLQSQGLDMKTYIRYASIDEEKLNENFRPQAERQVKIRLALEKIVDLENIKPTDEDLDNEYKKLSEQYHIEFDKIKNIVPEKELLKDIAVEKAMEIVRENAVTL